MNNTFKKSITKNIALFLTVAIFFSLDRYLKYLALHIFPADSFNLVGNLLKFSFTKNNYIAFSLPLSGPILNLTICTIVFSLFCYIFYLILVKKSYLSQIYPLTLILFGAISNLTDRLQFGFVVDYFDLNYFTVFNLADMMIVGGIIMLLCYLRNQK